MNTYILYYLYYNNYLSSGSYLVKVVYIYIYIYNSRHTFNFTMQPFAHINFVCVRVAQQHISRVDVDFLGQ